MATRNFFAPGVDPDSVSPWPATQADMEVMFRQMTPATDLGMCIQQSSVPNVVTYTELATFLWLKTTTGELHYYDGAGWEKVRAITSVEASDVTGVLDAFTGLGASRVLRRNAANNAYEWVASSSLFSSNSFPVANLANAAGSGYVVTSTTGGAWTTELFSTLWDTRFGLTQLPIIQIYDVDGTSTAGQVLKANGAGNAIAPTWIEDLLRDNQTPTDKLNLGGVANAGKYPRVNSTGTDLEFVASSAYSVSTLVDSRASGTAATSVPNVTLTKAVLAGESLESWCSVASNEFTLAAGTYLVEALVPVAQSGTGDKGYVALCTGASTKVRTVNFQVGDNDQQQVIVKYKLTVASSTTYWLGVWFETGSGSIGIANSITGIPEVYTQVSITKLA